MFRLAEMDVTETLGEVASFTPNLLYGDLFSLEYAGDSF